MSSCSVPYCDQPAVWTWSGEYTAASGRRRWRGAACDTHIHQALAAARRAEYWTDIRVEPVLDDEDGDASQ